MRPQVVAHRGASHEVAEHTLGAYLAALDAGAEAFECDVRLTADGHLVGNDGAEVVRQVANPDVPGFAEPGDPTAAAEVRDGDQVWFVLARHVEGGDPEYYPVPAEVLQPKPTMEAFLQRCRNRYADGEGLE